MAQDDFFVIVYKILSYLYDCMKKNKEPDENVIRSIAGVDGDYFTSIAEEMMEHHLVKGFAPYRFGDGISGVNFGDPRITMEGIEYLQENSKMQKIAGAFKELKSSLPFL